MQVQLPLRTALVLEPPKGCSTKDRKKPLPAENYNNMWTFSEHFLTHIGPRRENARRTREKNKHKNTQLNMEAQSQDPMSARGRPVAGPEVREGTM